MAFFDIGVVQSNCRAGIAIGRSLEIICTKFVFGLCHFSTVRIKDGKLCRARIPTEPGLAASGSDSA